MHRTDTKTFTTWAGTLHRVKFILCDTELNTAGVKVSIGLDMLHEKCGACGMA